jgi:hypothetical protein
MMSFWGLFFIYASILTYLVVGFIVAFEAVLAMSGSEFAIKWIRRLYNLRGFMISVYIFYPMLWLVYFFLEILPYYLGGTKQLTKFDIPMMLYRIFPDECDACDLEE